MFTCQTHPETEALWECPDCQGYYCGECVKTVRYGTRPSHICTPCDTLCQPVAQMESAVGLTSSLAGVFRYPLTDSGPMALAGGVIGLGFAQAFLGPIGSVIALGLIAGYSLAIIRATAMGDDELPDWQDFIDLMSIGQPVFLALAAGVVSFGPAVWLATQQSFGAATLALGAGVVYAPMAWIAVARYGRVFAVTPPVVLPLIARAGGEYWLASSLLLVVGIAEAIGQAALGWFMPPFLGLFIVKAFSLYALAVEMRILGIVWRRREAELGFREE